MTVASVECAHGDHLWRGGGVCSCGARLRCYCGRFVTEDGIEAHLTECPTVSVWLTCATTGSARS